MNRMLGLILTLTALLLMAGGATAEDLSKIKQDWQTIKELTAYDKGLHEANLEKIDKMPAGADKDAALAAEKARFRANSKYLAVEREIIQVKIMNEANRRTAPVAGEEAQFGKGSRANAEVHRGMVGDTDLGAGMRQTEAIEEVLSEAGINEPIKKTASTLEIGGDMNMTVNKTRGRYVRTGDAMEQAVNYEAARNKEVFVSMSMKEGQPGKALVEIQDHKCKAAEGLNSKTPSPEAVQDMVKSSYKTMDYLSDAELQKVMNQNGVKGTPEEFKAKLEKIKAGQVRLAPEELGRMQKIGKDVFSAAESKADMDWEKQKIDAQKKIKELEAKGDKVAANKARQELADSHAKVTETKTANNELAQKYQKGEISGGGAGKSGGPTGPAKLEGGVASKPPTTPPAVKSAEPVKSPSKPSLPSFKPPAPADAPAPTAAKPSSESGKPQASPMEKAASTPAAKPTTPEKTPTTATANKPPALAPETKATAAKPGIESGKPQASPAEKAAPTPTAKPATPEKTATPATEKKPPASMPQTPPTTAKPGIESGKPPAAPAEKAAPAPTAKPATPEKTAIPATANKPPASMPQTPPQKARTINETVIKTGGKSYNVKVTISTPTPPTPKTTIQPVPTDTPPASGPETPTTAAKPGIESGKPPAAPTEKALSPPAVRPATPEKTTTPASANKPSAAEIPQTGKTSSFAPATEKTLAPLANTPEPVALTPSAPEVEPPAPAAPPSKPGTEPVKLLPPPPAKLPAQPAVKPSTAEKPLPTEITPPATGPKTPPPGKAPSSTPATGATRAPIAKTPGPVAPTTPGGKPMTAGATTAGGLMTVFGAHQAVNEAAEIAVEQERPDDFAGKTLGKTVAMGVTTYVGIKGAVETGDDEADRAFREWKADRDSGKISNSGLSGIGWMFWYSGKAGLRAAGKQTYILGKGMIQGAIDGGEAIDELVGMEIDRQKAEEDQRRAEETKKNQQEKNDWNRVKRVPSTGNDKPLLTTRGDTKIQPPQVRLPPPVPSSGGTPTPPPAPATGGGSPPPDDSAGGIDITPAGGIDISPPGGEESIVWETPKPEPPRDKDQPKPEVNIPPRAEKPPTDTPADNPDENPPAAPVINIPAEPVIDNPIETVEKGYVTDSKGTVRLTEETDANGNVTQVQTTTDANGNVIDIQRYPIRTGGPQAVNAGSDEPAGILWTDGEGGWTPPPAQEIETVDFLHGFSSGGAVAAGTPPNQTPGVATVVGGGGSQVQLLEDTDPTSAAIQRTGSQTVAAGGEKPGLQGDGKTSEVDPLYRPRTPEEIQKEIDALRKEHEILQAEEEKMAAEDAGSEEDLEAYDRRIDKQEAHLLKKILVEDKLSFLALEAKYSKWCRANPEGEKQYVEWCRSQYGDGYASCISKGPAYVDRRYYLLLEDNWPRWKSNNWVQAESNGGADKRASEAPPAGESKTYTSETRRLEDTGETTGASRDNQAELVAAKEKEQADAVQILAARDQEAKTKPGAFFLDGQADAAIRELQDKQRLFGSQDPRRAQFDKVIGQFGKRKQAAMDWEAATRLYPQAKQDPNPYATATLEQVLGLCKKSVAEYAPKPYLDFIASLETEIAKRKDLATRKNKADALWAEAVELYKVKQKLVEAENKCRESVNADPSPSDAHKTWLANLTRANQLWTSGATCKERGDWEGTLAQCKESLSLAASESRRNFVVQLEQVRAQAGELRRKGEQSARGGRSADLQAAIERYRESQQLWPNQGAETRIKQLQANLNQLMKEAIKPPPAPPTPVAKPLPAKPPQVAAPAAKPPSAQPATPPAPAGAPRLAGSAWSGTLTMRGEEGTLDLPFNFAVDGANGISGSMRWENPEDGGGETMTLNGRYDSASGNIRFGFSYSNEMIVLTVTLTGTVASDRALQGNATMGVAGYNAQEQIGGSWRATRTR